MKISFLARILVLLLALSTLPPAASLAQTSIYKAPVSGPSAGTQRVALTYRAIFDIPTPINGEVRVTVPFPADDEVQRVEKYSFGSAMSPEKLLSVSLERDAVYGNRSLEIRVLNPAPGDELVFDYEISRKEKSNALDVPIKADAKILMPEKQFLVLDTETVSSSRAKFSLPGYDDLLNAQKDELLTAQIPTSKVTRDEEIKMVYRKIISFLNESPKANDIRNERIFDNEAIRALLRPMIHKSGIPAKYESGVLIPLGKDEGGIGDAHTWTNLFHPQRGWVPIDPFEGASKKRYADYYLGNISSDHISFIVGDEAVINPSAEKRELKPAVPPSNMPTIQHVPMKMQISFKRLPNSNPMITPDQSSGVE